MIHDQDSFELEISCLEVKELLDAGEEFSFLDVRTEFERELACIDETDLVTQELVDEIIAEWPKDRRIVLYCHTGIRSLAAARFLIERGGFSNAKSMAGGISAWSANVDPSIPQY